jgi:endoglucanase
MVVGVNLSGMEWAGFGLRSSASTVPNINFTVPRAPDVTYLAANGYRNTRLPITWELLQPMLHDTVANAAARAMIGEPGAFHPGYESYITGVLDAHAAVGAKCILDLHNFARYRDFRFQPDGSVIGLTKDPSNPLVYAFTTDPNQVQMRIMALAPGATLKQSNFVNFWTQAARKWKDHPGFGGYGLMNEPFNLPVPGGLTESSGGTDDLTIWPAYAQAAINAIRAIDPVTPIYLGGNEWSSAASLFSKNPSWPLTGANIIYEVHTYLDAASSGQRFDFDTEVAAGFNAGFISGPITLDTGADRLRLAVDWAKPRGLKLALTETGMPVDDPRWEEMWRRLLVYARENNVDVYSWNGGNHWALHNAAINHVPGWHQNKTLEPAMSGPMKAVAGINIGTLFDDGPGWAPNGGSVTITVYARGNLGAPVTLNVSSSNGGRFSKTTITIPAGSNGQDTFTFTPSLNTVTTLSYTTGSGLAPPPPRKVFSLSDPVAYAATNLADAALAIVAKYSACKWELADGYTDYMQGVPAAAGQRVRAISDSGYGSSPGNAMEMINWINDAPGMGGMVPPVMRVTNGRKNSDHSGGATAGFWCKKTMFTELQRNPRNRMPYDITDPHFAIAAVSVPGPGHNGVAFQASHAGAPYGTELRFGNSQPQARWRDNFGLEIVLTSPTPLAANAPAVLSLTSQAGSQKLRVNASVVGTASVPAYSSSTYDQMLIGWGFQRHFPVQGFGGNVYSVITGKGVPSDAELLVMERYLGSTAGIV